MSPSLLTYPVSFLYRLSLEGMSSVPVFANDLCEIAISI